MKSMKCVLLKLSGWFVCGAFVTVLILPQSANATIIAYDGFGAGGTQDGRETNATSYTTSPASTNGMNNDSLHSQSPISTGFADADAWDATNGIVTASTYFQAQSDGLIYPHYKPNTNGQARFFRSSGIGDNSKFAMRDAITTDTSDIQWVAMLVDFSSVPSTNNWYQDFVVTLKYGEPGDTNSPYAGAWTPATFGVRQSDGKAFYRTVDGTKRQHAYTEAAVSQGTHLFLMKFDHGYSADSRYDDVTFWFDPILTADPNDLTGGFAAVSIMRSDLGGGLHAFDEITISAAVKTGNAIYFDEFVITDDYADIMTPATFATFQTVDATYIRSGYANVNNNDSSQIIVGPTTGDIIRGLIEFDVSAIPSSDQINSASLFLTTHSSLTGINDVGALGDLTAFNVYAYGFDIDETTATWNVPDANANDGSGGTSGTLLTTASFDVEGNGMRVLFDDTSAFRAAVAAAADGDGFLRLIVRGADETVGVHNFARFSDETVSLINRPELLVTHQYVPRQGTVIVVY
ncbi:MAG: DNRLRE domain-containing protein [Kiritimatiellae bacterium]|jgi:hypothetical protein|nr:DNRLRE domain-containing protein [Kiritimatiellia bacterium]